MLVPHSAAGAAAGCIVQRLWLRNQCVLFSMLQAFLAMLRRQNQRWVPILDPSIHVNRGYAAYDSGIARDVFVKDITGRPYVGQVRTTCLCHARLA